MLWLKLTYHTVGMVWVSRSSQLSSAQIFVVCSATGAGLCLLSDPTSVGGREAVISGRSAGCGISLGRASFKHPRGLLPSCGPACMRTSGSFDGAVDLQRKNQFGSTCKREVCLPIYLAKPRISVVLAIFLHLHNLCFISFIPTEVLQLSYHIDVFLKN